MAKVKTSPPDIETLTNLSKTKTFLGKEFLTWLWFISEKGEEALTVSLDDKPHEVRVWVDDRIVLESPLAKNHVYSMKGGSPSQSAEASIALSSGKTVKELKLGVDIESLGEFHCSLNAKDLAPRSLRLPVVSDGQSTGETLEQRLFLTDAFVACLDSLFSQFLSERIKKDWPVRGAKTMRLWMEARAENPAAGSLH